MSSSQIWKSTKRKQIEGLGALQNIEIEALNFISGSVKLVGRISRTNVKLDSVIGRLGVKRI